jgi:hypothetical protein
MWLSRMDFTGSVSSRDALLQKKTQTRKCVCMRRALVADAHDCLPYLFHWPHARSGNLSGMSHSGNSFLEASGRPIRQSVTTTKSLIGATCANSAYAQWERVGRQSCRSPRESKSNTCAKPDSNTPSLCGRNCFHYGKKRGVGGRGACGAVTRMHDPAMCIEGSRRSPV